jgi:hypothetical protein
MAELKTRLSQLKPQAKVRSITTWTLPPLLFQHFQEHPRSTIHQFCVTDAGQKFYKTHVWRTVQLWVKRGHLKKVRHGEYERLS